MLPFICSCDFVCFDGIVRGGYNIMHAACRSEGEARVDWGSGLCSGVISFVWSCVSSRGVLISNQ